MFHLSLIRGMTETSKAIDAIIVSSCQEVEIGGVVSISSLKRANMFTGGLSDKLQ